MKKIVLLVLLAVVFSLGKTVAQTTITTDPMSFYIVQDFIPPVLDIVPGSVAFEDPNHNGVIDANEVCHIRFLVKNSGRGDGVGCTTMVEATGTTEGLTIKELNLNKILKGQELEVMIPIEANELTKTGEIALKIKVSEPNGFDTQEVLYRIGTHKLRTPMVEVASYKLSGESSGRLEKRKNFSLQLAVQNTDYGEAENVMLEIRLPNNVSFDGGAPLIINLANLSGGEKRVLNYELRANQNAEDSVVIEVLLEEKTGQYAKNSSIPVRFGEYVGSTIAMNVERKDQEKEIRTASLVSAVDINIPQSGKKNNNTFVLIIANEEYKQVAPVPFALNDGNVFRQYCMLTLGIPEKNIRYLPNATLNDIRMNINWLENITSVFDNPNVIVYYAGHGVPDESNKTAYLLPVDGSGTDFSTGYKLDDLYATLGHMPADRIAVFMDACFSGSKRGEGMLVSARGIALKVKSGVPVGNMVVFSAAQGDETAYPNNDEQHGMFTYFLLKKLQETQGNVTLDELGEYIIRNVRQQSVYQNGKSQTPSINPSYEVGENWKNWTLNN